MNIGNITFVGQIEDGLIQIEKDLGCQTFTWSGQQILCHPSTFTFEDSVSVGGNPVLKEGNLYVRVSQLTNGIPRSQQILTFTTAYGTFDFKIARVKPDPSHVFFKLELESDRRHA